MLSIIFTIFAALLLLALVELIGIVGFIVLIAILIKETTSPLLNGIGYTLAAMVVYLFLFVK